MGIESRARRNGSAKERNGGDGRYDSNARGRVRVQVERNVNVLEARVVGRLRQLAGCHVLLGEVRDEVQFKAVGRCK